MTLIHSMEITSEALTSSKSAGPTALRLGLFHDDTAWLCALEWPEKGPEGNFSHGWLPAGLCVWLVWWAWGEPGRSHTVARTLVDGILFCSRVTEKQNQSILGKW